MDRQGNTTQELAPKIENVWTEFQKSARKIEIDYDKNEFNTSFCYKLDTEVQKAIAKIGIDEFSKLIPFVLAFIPKISRVEIIDNTVGKNTVFEKNELCDSLIIPISRIENGEKTEVLILYNSNDRVSIATEIEKIENGYSIKNINNFPKLFCDFPLIGTEKFYFPVVVNSFFFNPINERDGIWLKDITKLKVQENRELLENAVGLYKDLIFQLEERDFFDLYNLVETRIPSTNEKYFDENWYEYNIQKPIREFILNAKIVETKTGKFSLDEVRFPDPKLNPEDREKIWQFSSDLKINKLPLIQHIHKWAKLIWKNCKKVDIEDLIVDLKGKTDISTLINTLEVDEELTFIWLNDCLDFIKKIGNYNSFNNNSLIPNQRGKFKNCHELALDEIEAETIKEICFFSGYDYYNELIHKDIFFKYDYIEKIKLQDIANKITELLSSDSNNDSENRKKAIIMLTEWFEHNEDKGKTFFSNLYKKKEKLLVDTIDDKENLYCILRNKKSLSELVDISNKIEENKKIIDDAIEINSILKEFNVSNLSELKEMLKSAKNTTINNPQVIISQDTLLSLGVTSIDELNEAFKDKSLSSQFIHTSIPTVEMFEYVQGLISRTKENVIAHLKTHQDYDCSEWEELATTVIGGINKQGLPIHIVVRPSDNGQVIVYYSSEKDALDYENAELWIDNGKEKPKHLTLGKIIKKTGINKIPV
ncbi:MAG: hypothetical protein NTW85_09160 [Methylococcales bacterium]|nr:hypothetical protein [Methylococcales bacterium]